MSHYATISSLIY